jgi:4a-hydroxytetrahydrobiopterin dehydratase
MSASTTEELISKSCRSCAGDVPPLAAGEVQRLLAGVEGWRLAEDGRRICRGWTARNFLAAIDFFNKVADLAEQEGHHPDLHLEGYRHVTIELWTHAIGGLSENDFILAAKIDRIPIALRA